MSIRTIPNRRLEIRTAPVFRPIGIINLTVDRSFDRFEGEIFVISEAVIRLAFCCIAAMYWNLK